MRHFQAMHICFICNEYPTISMTYGGLGTFTRTMARALVCRGHHATIIGAYETAGVSNDEGINIVRVAYSRRGSSGVFTTAYRMRQALYRLHAAEPIDIIDSAELG